MNIGDLLGPALSGSGYVGVLNFHGFLLGIEHATGSVNPWSGKETRASYGEFPGTEGNDGDPIDFLLGHDWDSDRAYVIQQRVPPEQDIGGEHNAGNGGPPQYDEDKVVLGASSEDDARALFHDYYQGSGREIGDVIEMTLGELEERIQAPERRGLALFKGLTDAVTGGPIVARFYGALDRLAKSQTPPPGFTPIPGGSHGGYRKRKARGWEYWYPDEHKETDHPDWELIPGLTGTDTMKPGQFAQVMGHGSKLFRWTPEHGGELPDKQTWMVDLETGEHVAVLANRVQPVRGSKARSLPPPPPPPKPQAPKPKAPETPRAPKSAPKEGDNRPRTSPTSEVPATDAPRVPVFAGSTAKKGTILHNIENGAYGVLRYRDAAGRTQVGMYIPQEDQKKFLAEMRGLTHAAVAVVAKSYRVREKGDGGGVSPEYQDLYAAAQLGLVQAVRAYKGKVPFAAHAHRYMRTYAVMEARDSLGRGVPVPSRVRRLTEGYLAAVNRAQIEFETDSPTDEQVAQAWHVTKKHVFQRDLGRYVRPGGDGPTVVDQAAEQLPLESWQVKGPTGTPMGKQFPGKLELIDELRKFTAGDRTEGSEWMEDMQVAAVLPRHAAATMPVGTALHLRQEVDGILAQMEPSLAQALTLRWGLDDQEPLELAELAQALKLTGEGATKKAGVVAADKLLSRAKEAFRKLANERKAEVGAYVDAWSSGSPTERVVVEAASPDARSYAGLSAAFRGAEDDQETVDERVRIYTALAAEGDGKATEAALVREAKGAATPAERDELRARYSEARDKQRLRAFHLQTRTLPIDPSQVREPSTGTDPSSVSLYADDVIHGYMQAIARRGMPGFGPAPSGSTGPSKVWSDERLARYLGVPVERLTGRSGEAPQVEPETGG